jgi:hypothetical protein
MRRQDTIPGPVIARNSAWILTLGIATAIVSGAAGVVMSLLANTPLDVQAYVGWAILGIVLFGFPIIMSLIILQRR